MFLNDLILKPITQLFFPTLCHACSNELLSNEHLICNYCMSTLQKTNFHLVISNPVEEKLFGRVKFENATSIFYFSKKSKVQHLIHHFKYKKNIALGQLLARMMAKQLELYRWASDIQVIVPLPLSSQKLKWRGFNQSEIIASEIGVRLNIPVNNSDLVRIKNTSSQTKKSNLERIQNVQNAFSLNNLKAFENKHVLLIDDIITTGATIESCIHTLNQVHNCKVSVLSIAYATDL
ncbi:MAG: ComF family protein [Chitinophagaceae bacterium]|nr:MAG: putative amidophosphoribosyltransferase [Bacteroidetes bacterium OLB11]MCC6447264.1 ComF family protein [Chitinophagaceae bacterium]HMN31767.1 ComF family protein [Chitinophagaceae bacterium]